MGENRYPAENGWMEEEFNEIKEKLDENLKILSDLNTKFAVLNSEVQIHFKSDEKSFAAAQISLSEMDKQIDRFSGKVWWILGVGAALAFIAGLIFK